uniref:E3 ubiquitin-protein ligase PRT1 isoform X2 n=1 Tax=Erigeron canadensis TaxID=72917 RepID=UPI001CB890DF|nr:E3 ubiquitin-protein ligase PRT1 isoform X2 [Erigeron canadensis]
MEFEEEANESEHVSDHFICAVCLDLLFKPIVLVCGHVTCFWCCHCSMDMRGQSHCPLCRNPYRHFPAICRMLDVFLKKLYPISYDRRKKQTLVDLDEKVDDLSMVDQTSHLTSEDNVSLNSSSNEEIKSRGEDSGGNCNQVTVADVLCAACKQLLFRPCVLNCGHVYCEACITIQEDEVIKCQVCQCRHPSGFPKVCKELDYALEEQFSSVYALRRSSTQLRQEPTQIGSSSKANDQGPEFSYPTDENFLQWWTVNGSKFHPGVGCDMCGVCPIIGDRYQCKDCIEKSGYDLCGDCYNTDSKLPGRFNQKHTPQHRLELVKPAINRDVIYRLLSGQLAIVSAASQSLASTGNEISFSLDDIGADGDGDAAVAANDDDNGVDVVPTESASDPREG